MYRDRGRYSDSVTIPTVRATRTFRNDIEGGKPRFLLKTLGSSRRASTSGSLRLGHWQDRRRPPAVNPDFTNAPGHGDDDARFYDRQQAYIHARGG